MISNQLASIGYAILAVCLIWTLGNTYIAWRRDRDDHRYKDD